MSVPPRQPTPSSGSPGALTTGSKVGLGLLGCFAVVLFTGIVGSCTSALFGGGTDQGAPAPAETATETVKPTATETTEVEVTVTATETVTERPQDTGGGGGTDDGGGAAYYENCDAARAAGAAPVRRGDPGYGPHLDRDGDGVGCE